MVRNFNWFFLLAFIASSAFAAEHGTMVRATSLYVTPGANSEKLMQVERGRDMVVLERTNMDNNTWIKVFVTFVQGESRRDVTGWIGQSLDAVLDVAQRPQAGPDRIRR